MDEYTRFEAERASIMNLPHITALKAEHEFKLGAVLDRMSAEILQEAFKLGFEAGRKSQPES